ncbi:serine hydrolase domain-containing protein [Rhodococcus sp. Q]|uniref:serine hydrolase domain-containing protein n=1 Tax=Rhodococcus sp. Q TaxID=2502252 RepID=UPI0010F86D15|nr:serine hydrolase domain-containing protein [Rhodococcus sp. Q]
MTVLRFATMCVTAFVLVTGCSTTTEPSEETAPSTASGVVKSVDQDALQAAVDVAAMQMRVPGAFVRVRTPQGTVDAAVGTTELGTGFEPDAGTHFRIASNTKTLTSALIMLLVQDGLLAFDDPVSEFVPGVPNGENITIAQLLDMRSGLYNYTEAPELAATIDADPAKAWTPQEVLDIAFAQPPNFPPGAEYEYNNTNYALLGLVAEKVGGRPLAEQFAERLFRPFGLNETSLPAADDVSIPRPLSHGYMYGESKYALVDEPYPDDLAAAARAGTVAPLDYTHQNPSYATAAGGAISTANDLATWIDALVSGEVFDADMQQQWYDSRRAEDPDTPDGQQYGYGISYQQFGPGVAMYYHGGELPGFNSFIGHDPDNDVTIVIWTNLTLSPDGATTANALLPVVLDQVYEGLPLGSPPPMPTPTR